jgi:hypothetical protein
MLIATEESSAIKPTFWELLFFLASSLACPDAQTLKLSQRKLSFGGAEQEEDQ